MDLFISIFNIFNILHKDLYNYIKRIFESIIVIIFQSVFYFEMYIYILKNLFLTSTYQNDLKTQKKKIII